MISEVRAVRVRDQSCGWCCWQAASVMAAEPDIWDSQAKGRRWMSHCLQPALSSFVSVRARAEVWIPPLASAKASQLLLQTWTATVSGAAVETLTAVSNIARSPPCHSA